MTSYIRRNTASHCAFPCSCTASTLPTEMLVLLVLLVSPTSRRRITSQYCVALRVCLVAYGKYAPCKNARAPCLACISNVKTSYYVAILRRAARFLARVRQVRSLHKCSCFLSCLYLQRQDVVPRRNTLSRCAFP